MGVDGRRNSPVKHRMTSLRGDDQTGAASTGAHALRETRDAVNAAAMADATFDVDDVTAREIGTLKDSRKGVRGLLLEWSQS